VYHLRDARSRTVESIQDIIRSLRDLNSSLDGANSQALHSCILEQERQKEPFPFAHPVHRLIYALRRLDILSQTEDSLWLRFSAFFRADPCLRRLEELEEDLKQRVQRMTVRGFASETEEYLIHTAGCPAYNRWCLQCTPNTRGCTDRRDVESSNTRDRCNTPAH